VNGVVTIMYPRDGNSFGILMYHRIAPRIAGVCRPTWNVPPERLRRQLAGLLSRGYQAWPLRRAVAHCRAGEPFPARVFVVTFDDGYDCIYRYAWPILKELSVPATVFMVTAYLDAEVPFDVDDWEAAGSAKVPASTWKPLSVAHCAEMLEHGLIEVGSHTHTHLDYYGKPEAFRRDVTRSLDVVRDAFGVEQPSFAFPFGRFDLDMVVAVRQAGALCALTTEEKLVVPPTDPFSWGRFRVHQSDAAAMLVLKLSGHYTVLRDAWHWVRGQWRRGRALLGYQDPHSELTTVRGVVQRRVASP